MSANLTSQRPNQTNTTQLLRPTGPGYGIKWTLVTGQTNNTADATPSSP